MIQDPAHEVILSDLALMENGQPVDYADGYTLAVMADDTSWGNPQARSTTVYSMLSAGSVVARDSDDNRTIVLRVSVTAPSVAGLELGEAALMAACNRPTLLSWLPPQSDASRSVFEVVDSSLEFLFDDLDELRFTRTWRITITALPYVRAENETTSPAVPSAAAVVIDSGSSTTNWTSGHGVVSTVAGAVVSTYPAGTQVGLFYGTRLTRVFPTPINTTTNKYLAFDWKASVPPYHTVRVNGDPSNNLAEVRRDPLAGGYSRSYYRLPADVTQLTSALLDVIHGSGNTGSATLSIDQMQVMQALPMIGTGRQQIRTIQTGGSAPTSGSIDVVHATSGLAEVIVYTYETQGGYQPALSPWRTTAGTFIADGNALAGGFWDLSTTPYRASVPVDALPHGEAFLMIRAHNTAIGSCIFDYAAYSEVVPGEVLGQEGGQFTHYFEAANVPRFILVPVPLNLPTLPMGPSGRVAIDVARFTAGGAGTTYIQESWLFNTAGSLSIVNVGTRKRLSLRAPSLDEPQGAMWTGNAADESDWYSVSSLATSRPPGGHILKPGINNVYTATTGAVDASVSATHFDRGHTHLTGGA